MKNTFFILIALFIVSCDIDGYGPSVQTNGVEVFYKPDNLKEKAKDFSAFLDTLEYGKNGTVSFQLVKDSLVHIKMVTATDYHTDDSKDFALTAMSLLAQSQLFPEEKVQLHVCDDRFNIMRSLKVIE